MSILVTGGAGYIGSHTCIELLSAGYEIVVLDNYSNSNQTIIKNIKEITNKDFKSYNIDLLDKEILREVFEQNKIEAVIHFAGFKAVGESVERPLEYYHNNITGTLNLCALMKEYGVKKIVFSSSATVYGLTDKVPINEESPLNAINPYGRTKLMIEEILQDLYNSDNEWGISLLRYFNPTGAHKSGKIGEKPTGIPNNLVPYIMQVAIGQRDEVKVFGNDYPTKDGTGVRDYIHVVDLAVGHIKALDKIFNHSGINAYNLGTGRGYSVLEMINMAKKVTNRSIPYKVINRRPGDTAISYADPTKAKKELNWTAKKGLEEMLLDSWRWQLNLQN